MIRLRRCKENRDTVLIVAPTLTGVVSPYLPIVRELREGVEVHGLKYIASEPDLTGTTRHYVEWLARLPTEGVAIKLLGWSFGGVLALDLAAQLEATGAPPARVLVIDTPLPVQRYLEEPFLDIMNKFYEAITGKPVEVVFETMADVKRHIVDQGQRLKPSQIDELYDAYMDNYLKWQRYEPPRTGADIVLFEASSKRYFPESMARWDTIATKLTREPLEGDHYSILKLPGAGRIAGFV